MDAVRFCGNVMVEITFVESEIVVGDSGYEETQDKYECVVKTPDGIRNIMVHPPAVMEPTEMKTPEAYDGTAHAALSFADDEDERRVESKDELEDINVGEWGQYNEEGSGWKIDRNFSTLVTIRQSNHPLYSYDIVPNLLWDLILTEAHGKSSVRIPDEYHETEESLRFIGVDVEKMKEDITSKFWHECEVGQESYESWMCIMNGIEV